MINNEKIHKIYFENGYYIFRLEELLSNINKTKYALSKDLPLEYKILNRYAHGDLQKFDASVVARICDYCDCKMSEIIEYYPNKN